MASVTSRVHCPAPMAIQLPNSVSTSIYASTSSLQSFIETQIQTAPIPYFHILGTHYDSQMDERCTDFDIWLAATDEQSLTSMQMLPPGSSEWVNFTTSETDPLDTSALLGFADSILEMQPQKPSLEILKNFNACDQDALQYAVERVAKSVQYLGRVATACHVAEQQVSLSPPAQSTDDMDTPSMLCAKISTTWRFGWPLQKCRPAPDAAPRRITFQVPTTIEWRDASNRSWETRLGDAMVERHQGDARQDDVRTTPYESPLKRARRLGGNTTIRTYPSGLILSEIQLPGWGGDT